MTVSCKQFGSIVNATTVRFEVQLPGPKMRVWDFLTKRELLELWLAQGSVDERVGSSVRLWFDTEEVPEREEHGAKIHGTVFRCELGSALSYSWCDDKTESLVVFELDSPDADVKLTVTHEDLPEALTPLCAAGWHTHLGILRARLEGHEPEPFLDTFQAVMPTYLQRMNELTEQRRTGQQSVL